MSCVFGVSPTPLTGFPDSVSARAFNTLLPTRACSAVSPWSVARFEAISLAGRVVPRAGADAIAGVHCCLTVTRLCAEVGVPLAITRVGGRGEHLAVGVRSGESAEVGTFTVADAGDEETHGRRRSFGFRLGRCRGLLRVAVDGKNRDRSRAERDVE